MNQIALLHPTGLLGSELREMLGEQRELWQDIRLLTTREDEAGHLTEVAGAAAMVTELEEGGLDSVDVAFFCGNIEESRPLFPRLSPAATAIILSPDATPEDGQAVVANVNLETARRGETILSPHPGTVLLAHLLYPLLEFRPQSIVATLIQPVSIHSRAGLDEVFEQTRSILRFDPNPPREIFPFQMAFNVVPNQTPSEHLVSHLGAVFGAEGKDLAPAVRILQGGIFHSYGASVYLRLGTDPGLEEFREALAQHPAIDMASDPEYLGMIDAAGRNEVVLGPVEMDPAGGYWIWAVMDNLTCGGALNAMRILETVLRTSVVN